MGTEKMIVHECIVVEGRDDSAAVKRAVKADTIETIGSAVPDHVLEQIELAAERRGVIVFTDPDYPGERIRRIVAEAIPNCKHAFLPKSEALAPKKKGIGVEHAQPHAIREALKRVRSPHPYSIPLEFSERVTMSDLHAAGLLAGPHAKERRARLGEILSIGYANGKQLFKRLNMFMIDKKEFQCALEQVLQKEEGSS